MPDHSAAKDIGGLDEVVSEVEGFLTTLLEQRYENNNVTRTTCLRYENYVLQVGLIPEHILREVPLTHPAVGVVVPVLADVFDVLLPPLEEHLAILRVVLLTEVLFELFRRPTWPPPFHRP